MESLHTVKWPPQMQKSTLRPFHGVEWNDRKRGRKGNLQYINPTPRPFSRDKFWGGNKLGEGGQSIEYILPASQSRPRPMSEVQCKAQTDTAALEERCLVCTPVRYCGASLFVALHWGSEQMSSLQRSMSTLDPDPIQNQPVLRLLKSMELDFFPRKYDQIYFLQRWRVA